MLLEQIRKAIREAYREGWLDSSPPPCQSGSPTAEQLKRMEQDAWEASLARESYGDTEGGDDGLQEG